MSLRSKCRLLFTLTLLVSALAALAAPPPAAGKGGDLDRIVAVVNDDVITESELTNRLAETRQQLTLEKIKLPTDEVLRRQLLEHMVMERIQLQLADRAGIRVTDAEVDQA